MPSGTDYTVTQKITLSLAGQPIAVRTIVEDDAQTVLETSILYLLTDHLGSTNQMVHHSNNAVVAGSTAQHYPFGKYRTQPTNDDTDMGFTGHRHNNDIGLIYMNARFYVDGIGRFASADTIVPDPSNPQNYNRYSYVLNSPINRIDPSGHISCAKLGTEECVTDENGNPTDDFIAPLPWDLTEVLVNEMVYHVQSPEMQAVREGNLSFGAYRDFYNLNCTGCLYDLKQTVQTELGSMVMLCGSTECGWFDYSTPGNIHFGYMAASVGIPLSTSEIAGGLLETITFFQTGTHDGAIRNFGENPRDFAGVQLGYILFELFGDELTTQNLQAGLDVFWDDLQRPDPRLLIPLLTKSSQKGAEVFTYYRGALEYNEQ